MKRFAIGLLLLGACSSSAFSADNAPMPGAAGDGGEAPAELVHAGSGAGASSAGAETTLAESGGGAGPTASPGGAAGAPDGGAPELACTPLQRDQPTLPARCEMTMNHGCEPGGTCITLEQTYCSNSSCLPKKDLCMPTGITTSCADAGCLQAFTCACLQSDFRFDKTGLESWKCCDTAKGPLYVLPPLTCP